MTRKLKWYTGEYLFNLKEGSNGKIKEQQKNYTEKKLPKSLCQFLTPLAAHKNSQCYSFLPMFIIFRF